MTTSTLVGPLLQNFFTDHITAQRHLSPQTVASYRDTFRMLLQFIHRQTGTEPTALCVPELNAEIVLRFLEGLEKDRSNSIASRNLRLTAIRSFFRMVALRDPANVGIATRIMAIPFKRAHTKEREYLTGEEVEAILLALDRRCWCGRRDYALLLTMFNTGARVSEIATLRQNQLCLGPKGYVQLHGKGRKDRSIPLWPRTVKVLKEWFRELGQEEVMAFPSIRGESLTRFGIHLLLRKATNEASRQCPTLQKKRVSPHVLRHSTAMALLQSGVDLAVIGLWLGHESIETTNEYLHANLAIKEKALARLQPVGKTLRRFQADDALLSFLEAL